MARKSLDIKVAGKTVKLRLTAGGQRRLKDELGAEALSVILDAGMKTEYMLTLLQEALNWTDSGNTITDGEELYDLLVDEGYAGQGKFADLAIQIGVASGILDSQHGKKVSDYMMQSVDQLFDEVTQGEAAAVENPTQGADEA